jgi:hypothetical protein
MGNGNREYKEKKHGGTGRREDRVKNHMAECGTNHRTEKQVDAVICSVRAMQLREEFK